MIKFYLRLVILVLLCTQSSFSWAQGVLDPNDIVVTYNSSKPPVQPAYNQIGKWVRTKLLSWNTDDYKCYIYNGMQFRLLYPKNFNAADTTKKYPVTIVFHGTGSKGDIYNNEKQLEAGGTQHLAKRNDGSYDGFVIFPQNPTGFFGNTQYDYLVQIVTNFMAPQLHADIFRVTIDGYSAGGQAAWDMLIRHPKFVAGATPISAAKDTYDDSIELWKAIPVWHFQGGKDGNPNPAVATLIQTSAVNAGANYKLTIYPTQPHSIWNIAWGEADFFPFIMRANKANPWPLYNHYQYCTGETVNTTLCLTAGFDAYQWRKNGTVIPGATGNTLLASSYGTYDARVRSGNTWSDWSPQPVVVGAKAPTITPPITTSGLQSNVLPTPEGKDSVVLAEPDGYDTYRWMKAGGTDTLGRNSTFAARDTGGYIVRVTEKYGCSDNFSAPFRVIPAKGAHAPDAAAGLIVSSLSQTSLKLNWIDKPSPAYNETFFEIYRTLTPGTKYQLVAKVNADVLTYTDASLPTNTRFYYIVRAVNDNGAAPVSNEASATTKADTTAPGAPGALTKVSATRNTIRLKWSAASDNVGVDRYDVYVDGIKSYTTPKDSFAITVYGLNYRQVYNFVVKARDLAGNESPASNQVSVAAVNATDTITLGKVPAIPYNLTAVAASSNQLRLSWADSSGRASAFEIYKSTTSGGTYKIIATVAANAGTYTDAGLSPNTSYYYKLKAINKYGGSDLSNYIQGTTSKASLPTSPNALTATAVSANRIDLQWTDRSNNETSFELYRSYNNNTTYLLLASLAANAGTTVQYADTGLFANGVYYYKVLAKNGDGSSGYSNELTKQTLNSLPVISGLANQTMRYGTQLTYHITATDPDNEAVTQAITGLPAFAAITDSSAGSLTVIFSPAQADTGAYTITTTATDQHNGVTTRTFKITVDDNYQPVISPIANITLAEKDSLQVSLSASDQNATDTAIWTVTGLPSFATLTPAGHTAQLLVKPGYANAGTYNVTVKVSDGRSGLATQRFTITVTDVNPNYNVYVNFTDGSYTAGSPWNNTNKKPLQNDIYSGWKDDKGNASGFSMTVLTPWQTVNGGANTNNQGYNAGSNAGLYPDNVMTSNWWTNTDKQTMQLSGLPTANKYNFTFFGSRYGVADNRIASYTINGSSVTLNASNNTSQTVTINNVRPDSAGNIKIDLQPAAGSQYAYINAMVITVVYDDGTAPAQPGNFAAASVAQGVKLSWTDQAYNEDSYEVYRRSATPTDTFTLIHTGAANDTAYTDAGAASGQTWYYKVRAVNSAGASPFTDSISILVPNKAPVLAAIDNVIIKADSTRQIALSATDAAGDTITLRASGFPAFATLNATGNGTATLQLAPASANIGKYTLTVVAKDNKGDSSSQSFTVQVVDNKISTVYVNCNQVQPAGAPWNNFNSLPNVNAGILNMKDETGLASGISITILDAFTGANNVGAVTGTNTGVYPDTVMQTFFYDQSGNARRIRLSGLTATRKYNLVFFGSRAAVSDNRNTIYAAGSDSVILNAASNTANTVQLNGLAPDSSGNIIFTVKQAPGSFSAYLNTLVIQSYVDDGIPIAPDNLSATSASRTSIQLAWADKASNETGYEIWRANSKNGTYTVLATVGANVAAYTDNNVSANTVYYYKVRTLAGAAASAFSNIAGGSTMAYSLSINFTSVNLAPAPWTNITVLPDAGYKVTNLKDDGSNTTGVNMTFLAPFAGSNPAGKQTGNNSGVYPDKVLAESFYTEGADTARIKMSGLDQLKEYSFTFLGSRADVGTRITGYKIGSRAVTLDANNNTQNTVTIDKVKPDNNGEVYIDIYSTVDFGHLNAMVVKVFPATDSSNIETLPVNVAAATMANGRTTQTIGIMGAMSGVPSISNTPANAVEAVTVYPNPFTSFINLNFTISSGQTASRIQVRVIDMNGRPVLLKDLGNRGSGAYQERLEINNQQLQRGIYLLQVLSGNNQIKTLKLVKQ